MCKVEICRAGHQDGREGGTLQQTEAAVQGQNFLREASTLLLRPFNWLNEAYLDYLG